MLVGESHVGIGEGTCPNILKEISVVLTGKKLGGKVAWEVREELTGASGVGCTDNVVRKKFDNVKWGIFLAATEERGKKKK